MDDPRNYLFKYFFVLLINYFKLSFAAILYEWVEKGMEEDEKYLIKNLTLIINKGLDDLVDRFEEKTIKERQK